MRQNSGDVGLADLVVRAKYTVWAGREGGFAAAADVRLPTGRQENLLGAGTASVKALAIASIERGRTAFHVNGGEHMF